MDAMYKSVSDNVFEGILKTAFNQYVCSQLENEPSNEELEEKYPIPKRELRMAKKLSKKVKFGKPLVIVYLKRACVIALVCLCAFFATIAINANGEDFWKITKKVYTSLTEKIEYFFGSMSVATTTDFNDFDSLEDLKESVDLNGALLPRSLEEKYTFDRIYYSDFGEFQEVSIKIFLDGEAVGEFIVDLNKNGGLINSTLVKIGKFNVVESHYDNIHQFEFIYEGNYYLIYTHDYDVLLEITESLE